MRKIWSVLFISVFTSAIMTLFITSAFAETDGTFENLKYTAYNDHIEITGYTDEPTEVIVPSEINDLSVTKISENAFANCWSLTSINIPYSVVYIGDYAFSGCSSLTSVTIPNGVTAINQFTFWNCYGLINITIPNSVTSIGNYAFCDCIGLTSVTIPDSVTDIGFGVFDYCINLTSITIPDSVTSIGQWAFSYCKSLSSITIPNSVTNIGRWVFDKCSNLTSITIPDSIIYIAGAAFEDCENLSDVYYRGTKEEWENIDIYNSNECLINATVHYNSIGTNPPTFTMSVNKGQLGIILDNTDYDSKLITVFSNGSIYNNFNLTDISAGDTSKQVDIPENSKFAKVFIWDSLSGMKPLCEAQEITIE